MSVQKIMNLTSKKNSQKKSAQMQETTNSIESQRNDTLLKSSSAIKNNFLAGISFKGYSKQITHEGYTYGYGTSGALRSEASSITKSDVHHNEGTIVREGSAGYDTCSYDKKVASVYYADPGEEITDEIRKSHKFIVEYDRPKDVSIEDIQKSNKTSKLKQMIDTLESNAKILQAKDKAKAEELDRANETLENTRLQYQKAKEKQEKKAQEKGEIEADIANTNEKIDLAKKRYKEIKAKEEEN